MIGGAATVLGAFAMLASLALIVAGLGLAAWIAGGVDHE